MALSFFISYITWHLPLVVNVVDVGPFEEEDITSDVVKVKDENPDTPGYRRGDRVRRDAGDFQSCAPPPWLARDEAPGP
jgi:hypothetical protein